MYYKSHKWIEIPNTVYERRRELRVRELKHTVMLFDKKYQNIDTGKFDTDKLHTLNTDTLANLMDREFNEISCINYSTSKFGSEDNSYQGLEEQYNAYKFPEREKKLQKERRRKEREQQRIDTEQKVKHEEWKAYKEELRQYNEEYERRVRERQEREKYNKFLRIHEEALERKRLAEEQQKSELIFLGGSNHGQRIITSKWRR